MPANPYFTIKDLADQYGVSLRTLRFYEERELLKPLRIGSSRCYTSKDKIRLELIIKGRKLGFSLSEIWQLIASESLYDPKKIETLLNKDEIVRQLRLLEDKHDAIAKVLSELEAALAARHAQEQKSDD